MGVMYAKICKYLCSNPIDSSSAQIYLLKFPPFLFLPPREGGIIDILSLTKIGRAHV